MLGLGHGYYGALPLDFTIFGDGGLAWDSNNEPSFSGGDRDPVFSAGAGFRFNLFGFAVAEVNVVRPFDRPAEELDLGVQLPAGVLTIRHPERSEGGHAEHGPLRCAQGDNPVRPPLSS